jgi:hypothetical protein
MTVALAGRRIDAPDATQVRFPPQNREMVKQRIHSLFEKEKAETLVCSAANGADLLALEIACDLRMGKYIILPYAPEMFRRTSVIDRPGEWGVCFDRVLSNLTSEDRVISLGYTHDSHEVYIETNHVILEQAQSIAKERKVRLVAALVWNGESRGQQDATWKFEEAAKAAGIPVRQISTL